MKCTHARTHSHTHVSIWLPVKAVSSELNRWRPFRREKKSPWGGLLTGKCHYSISARWRVPFTQHWLIRAVIFVSLLSVNRLFTKDSFLLHNSSANVLRFHAGATKGPTSHAKLFYALRVSVVVTTTSRSMIDFTSRVTWRWWGRWCGVACECSLLRGASTSPWKPVCETYSVVVCKPLHERYTVAQFINKIAYRYNISIVLSLVVFYMSSFCDASFCSTKTRTCPWQPVL